MRFLISFVLLRLVNVVSTRNVEDADLATFEQLTTTNSLVLAAFTSNTLESLQQFHKIFQKAGEKLDTPFVKIDCDTEKDLCDIYDVNAYPTIRLFKRSEQSGEIVKGHELERGVEVLRYRGKKTKNALRSFVTKHSQPILTHIEPHQLTSFKSVDEIVIIAYLRPDQEALREIFSSVASKHHGSFVFGYVDDMSTADTEGRAMPSIVAYRSDGNNKVINGHFNEESVENLLEISKVNIIGEFSERIQESYMARDKLSIYIFTADEDDETTVRNELTPLATKYEKVIKIGVADAVEYSPMAKSFGLVENIFPALVVHAPMNDNVFLYKQGKIIVAEMVEAMLTTILQAKARPGQVFGEEAPDFDVEGAESIDGSRHDEL